MLLLLFYYVLFKITIISNQTPISNKNYYEIQRHNLKFQKTKTWVKEFIETLNTMRWNDNEICNSMEKFNSRLDIKSKLESSRLELSKLKHREKRNGKQTKKRA